MKRLIAKLWIYWHLLRAEFWGKVRDWAFANSIRWLHRFAFKETDKALCCLYHPPQYVLDGGSK